MAWIGFFQPTVFAIPIVLMSLVGNAQPRPWMPPQNMVFSATGTGETTGYIAILLATNNSNQPQQLDLGNFYIPSGGKFQSYVVPEIQSIEVPPMGSVTVDIHGYCADISRPPVGNGQPMPAPESWLVPSNPVKPDGPPSFIVVPAAVQVVDRKPGQAYIDNVPVGYVSTTPDQAIIVDADKFPEQAASFLLDAINRITFTFDDLKPDGVINTPFSSTPPREREAVIQQTFWMYGAALTGDVYDKEQFAEQLAEQYESGTGHPISAAPPSEIEKFEDGTTDFWDSFSLVGIEAKVISVPVSGTLQGNSSKAAAASGASASASGQATPNSADQPRAVHEIESDIARVSDARTRAHKNDHRYLDEQLRKLNQELKESKAYHSTKSNPGASALATGVAKGAAAAAKQPESPVDDTKTEDPPATTEEPQTEECQCGFFSMKLRVKKPDGSYDRYFDVDHDLGQIDDPVANTVDATAAKLAVGEEIEFEISDVEFECSCEQSAPCDTYIPRRIYSNEPKRNAKSGSHKIHTRDELCETIKNNKDNTKVTAKPRFSAEECDEMEVKRQYGFLVEQVCQTESCGAVSCYVYVFIRL